MSSDVVEGCEFAADSSVTITVRDGPGGPLLLSQVAATDGGGCFWRVTGLPLAPGMFITVGDTVTEKQLQLVLLTIEQIDWVGDTVSGRAPPNTNLHADAAPPGSGDFTSAPPVTSDGNGDWTADFGAVDFDIVPGTHVGADISDADGDSTAFDVTLPNTRFEGSVSSDSVYGCEFAVDSSVTITVRDGPGGSVLLSKAVPTDGGGCFNLVTGLPLAPGMFITVDDTVTEKQLQLVLLTIEQFDWVGDTVSGRAPSNTNVHVDAAPPGSNDFTSAPPVTSDGNGDWTADFGAVDFDIVSGTHVGADITDDDGDATAFDVTLVPSLAVGDVTVTEGDVGTTTATFTVSLSPPGVETVNVDYATADGSATAPDDYLAASGTLTFAAGETTKTIGVTVNGDLLDEAVETFTVGLTNPLNATASDAEGLGTIDDDDVTDTTPPETTIDSGPSGSTTDATPTFTFSANEGGASFQCRLDGATFAPCTSPHTTGVLVIGAHTFEVRAIDAVGNIDATPATRTFTIAAPVVRTTVRLVSTAVTVTKGRVAPIRLRCGAGACRGTLRLQATVDARLLSSTAKRRKITLGTRSFSIRAGRTATVNVKLTVRGFKLLVRVRRLRAQALVSYRQVPGGTKTVTRAITLKAPKKPVR